MLRQLGRYGEAKDRRNAVESLQAADAEVSSLCCPKVLVCDVAGAALIAAVQGTLRRSRNLPFKYAGVGVFTGLPARDLSRGSEWVQ